MRFDLTNQTASSSSESPFELSLICLFLKDLGSCEDNEAETLGQTEDNYIHFQSNLMIKNSDIDGDYAVDRFGGDEFEKEVSTVQALTCPESPLPRFQVEPTFLRNWCPRLKWADCVIAA